MGSLIAFSFFIFAVFMYGMGDIRYGRPYSYYTYYTSGYYDYYSGYYRRGESRSSTYATSYSAGVASLFFFLVGSTLLITLLVILKCKRGYICSKKSGCSCCKKTSVEQVRVPVPEITQHVDPNTPNANPAEAAARTHLWGMETLFEIVEVDQLAATTMKIGQKRMFMLFLSKMLNMGDEIVGPIVPASATIEEDVAAADKLLDSIGLIENKTELQELTGASWTVHVLSLLEKGDLSTTRMSLAEKKMLIARAGEAAAAINVVRLAEKSAAVADATRIAAEEAVAEAEAVRAKDKTAAAAATLADNFIDGLGLIGHKMELQDALQALLLGEKSSDTRGETKEGKDDEDAAVSPLFEQPLQRFFEIDYPPGVKPGSIIQCTAPDGQCVQLTLPGKQGRGAKNKTVTVPFTSVNPVAAWSMKPLSQLLDMDHLAATTLKIGQKRMFLASTRKIGPATNVSYTPLGSGIAAKAEFVDKFLDGIGLLGYKTELQQLTGATWTMQVLSHIEKIDLAETSMSMVEKKMFMKKVAVASEEAAAAEAANKAASATAEAEIAARAKATDDAAAAEAASVAVAEAAAGAAIAADKFLDGIGLIEHKAELQVLTGATWSIERLSYLEKSDLSTTSMSLAEKKMLIVKAGKAAIDTTGEIAVVRETSSPHLPIAAVSTLTPEQQRKSRRMSARYL
jgi:hypothetical protein